MCGKSAGLGEGPVTFVVTANSKTLSFDTCGEEVRGRLSGLVVRVPGC
jgi:hypothetical protein